MTPVALIDSGVANIGSMRAALEREGAHVTVTRDWNEIARAPRVILPGVGAAAAAMRELDALGLSTRLPTLKQPVLGVCLGMQLLFSTSDEGGQTRCLGLFDGTIRRLEASAAARVPHMGWNALQILREHPLIAGLDERSYAYFVHSFAAPVSELTLASCQHGQPFCAIVARGNFMAAQFHPERSSAVGARLIRNFLAMS